MFKNSTLKKIVWTSLFVTVAAGSCFAGDTDDLLIRLQKTYPNIPFSKVLPTEAPGIYEADFGTDLLYTESTGTYFFPTMFNMKLQRNIGDERRAELSVVDFSTLPLADAIKIVTGDGSRQVAVFADPNCSYCKKLEGEISKVKNLTMYVFPVGILGADSVAKVGTLACLTGDKAKAWTNMMAAISVPAAIPCNSPLPAQNLELFKKLGFQGTPSLVFKSGKVLKGYAESSKIEAMLTK